MSNGKLFINKEFDENTLSSPFIKVDLKNVKQRSVPTTPEEFLMSVIAERESIEEVTRCNVDYTKYNKNQSLFCEEIKVAPAPDKITPTKEWQNIQVADFSEIRSYLSRMLSQKPPESKKIRKFNIKGDDHKRWLEYFDNNEPTLTFAFGFCPMQVDRGLEILTKLLEEIEPGESIDQKTGRWIYAFLSCLKQPLLSDSISIIRNLARQCATIRSQIDPELENARELAAPLNLIICIVGHYFKQLDLADSLE